MEEVLATSKINSNRLFIPKEVNKRFNFKHGDMVVWKVNRTGELVLEKQWERGGRLRIND